MRKLPPGTKRTNPHITVAITALLHRRALMAASKNGVTICAYCTDAITKAVIVDEAKMRVDATPAEKKKSDPRTWPRVTVNILPPLHRRASTAAVYNGIRIGVYAEQAISNAVALDEDKMREELATNRQSTSSLRKASKASKD